MICEAPSARRRERAALLFEAGIVDRDKLRHLLERFQLKLTVGLDA
jgi:hypothetical protein